MEKLRGLCGAYIGDRAFYRGALRVMIPVTVQQLINNLFNMVDSLMVGSLDVQGLAMSAVSVANKLYNVYFGLFFGMTGAAGLMISQYYGAKDRKTCQGLFSLQMALGLLISLCFFALIKLFPGRIMGVFVTAPRTVELGVRYMRVICYSYLPVAVSNTCIFSMRSLGLNRAPMLVSVATMLLNALCNYALIFGKLGFPALGVEGAAYGTLIARVAEMGVYLWLLFRRRAYFTLEWGPLFALPRRVIRGFAQKAVPLICNELLWTVGLNVYFWCYARLDEAALPAITIAEQCNQFSAVLSIGVASAVSVLIGTELGANRFQEAKANCKKLFSLDLLISLVAVGVCAALALALPGAFALSDELRRTATALSLILALLCPFQFVYGFCFYCLRAGGDAKGAMLLDSGYMWAVPVPAALLIGWLLPGKIPLTLAMLTVQFLMYSKVVLALIVLRRGKWVRNITAQR